MKRITLQSVLFALAAIVLPNDIWAHDFEVDGIYYNDNHDNNTASVVCSGDSYDAVADEYTGDVVIPATVTYNNVTYRVVGIENRAFGGCASLTSVTISEGVTRIASRSFSGCSGLVSVTIPASVTEINTSIFDNCRNLTSIVVKEGNTVYDSRNGCNAIIETATNTLLEGCSATVIPEGIVRIKGAAFRGCGAMFSSITIPASVTELEGNPFENSCSNLVSIVVAEGNTVYDSRNNCNAIIETKRNTLVTGCSVTRIPDGVTSIGNSAFRGCTTLTTVTIPNSVTSIGGTAFFRCI